MNPQPFPLNSGNIAVTITSQANGSYCCEITPSLEGCTRPMAEYYGQSPKHALAIALEYLAQDLMSQAEADQDLDWDAVDRSSSGTVVEKCFHVILHYERVDTAESKFEALHNTLLGNTVVENAAKSIIQIDPHLPITPLTQ